MKWENFNTSPLVQEKSLRKPRILVAPLDWGLGHATRCIPVVYELTRNGCEVWLATDGPQEALLRQEFPQLPVLSLRGYGVKYGHSAAGLVWNIARQSGRIFRSIRRENEWLNKVIGEYHFDGIISDNRYGLYHEKIPCVFITHQLTIKAPMGKWLEKLLRAGNYRYINRFTECWVPDLPGSGNLTGELSHPAKKPLVPVHFLGQLSRFTKREVPEIKGHLLILLSGPEPQRSILENRIINEVVHYPGTATIARGIPGSLKIIPSTGAIRFHNHLSTSKLEEEMNRAEYVISRSGYTTIMDIAKLGKKSILIPTPGQTEQQYLAGYLQEKRLAISIPQRSFSLAAALESAKSFAYSFPVDQEQAGLEPVVARFIHSLKKN